MTIILLSFFFFFSEINALPAAPRRQVLSFFLSTLHRFASSDILHSFSILLSLATAFLTLTSQGDTVEKVKQKSMQKVSKNKKLWKVKIFSSLRVCSLVCFRPNQKDLEEKKDPENYSVSLYL